MDCTYCDATLPISPMYLDGLPTCGPCIKRIEAHRSPVEDEMPAEERGDRCLDWITRDAALAIAAMCEADRSEWIRSDEWRRKHSSKRQVGEHARHWSFTHLV